MTGSVPLDLLRSYQRELDGEEGRGVLDNLKINSLKTVEHFRLGYASCGNDELSGCLVVPVFDLRGHLVELCGITPEEGFLTRSKSSQGLVNIEALKSYPEIVLCEDPLQAMRAFEHGYLNAVALPTGACEELVTHIDLFKDHVKKVCLVSKQPRQDLRDVLEGAEIEVWSTAFPNGVMPGELLDLLYGLRKHGELSFEGAGDE